MVQQLGHLASVGTDLASASTDLASASTDYASVGTNPELGIDWDSPFIMGHTLLD